MIHLEEHLNRLAVPTNLRINDRIQELRARCQSWGCTRPYHHFAFGESPFSPPPSVIEQLRRHADAHAYLLTAGLQELREAIASYYCARFGLDCSPQQVVVSPGSKEMIGMALAVVEGPVFIPTPSWVSYLPQARLLRKEVLTLRTRRQDGYKLQPESLEELTREKTQSILLLNHPHNPTGAVYSKQELQQIAEVCRRRSIVVIADEIYTGTAFSIGGFTSMSELYPGGHNYHRRHLEGPLERRLPLRRRHLSAPSGIAGPARAQDRRLDLLVRRGPRAVRGARSLLVQQGRRGLRR